MTYNFCPQCGVPTEIRESTIPRPGWHRRVCPAGHHLSAWVPCEVTLERAESFIIPFGRFVAMTFEQIDSIGGDTGKGRRYLEWLAEASEVRTVRRLAQIWLAAHPLADSSSQPVDVTEGILDDPEEPPYG